MGCATPPASGTSSVMLTSRRNSDDVVDHKVYGFLGATAGSFLFFIWPSVCVLRTRHPAFGIPLRISAWLVLLFGLAVASLGTYAVVMK